MNVQYFTDHDHQTMRDVLHILRNPWGHSTGAVRAARLTAANEIERLQAENANLAKRLVARNGGYQPLPDKNPGNPLPPKDE